jgi:hypothetical protein
MRIPAAAGPGGSAPTDVVNVVTRRAMTMRVRVIFAVDM